MKVVIITGGHIEDRFALQWLREQNYDLLMAADSGIDFLYRNSLIPDVIAGDYDSADEEAYGFYLEMAKTGKPEMIRLNPVKDDTDTEYVIRDAIRRGGKEITVLGGTGSRLDHVLGNIHLLGIGPLSPEPVEIALVDRCNRMRILPAGKELVLKREEQFGDYISVFPFAGPAEGVCLKGFQYPLEQATMEPYCSLGISNVITEAFATVSVRKGVLLIIESRD